MGYRMLLFVPRRKEDVRYRGILHGPFVLRYEGDSTEFVGRIFPLSDSKIGVTGRYLLPTGFGLDMQSEGETEIITRQLNNMPLYWVRAGDIAEFGFRDDAKVTPNHKTMLEAISKLEPGWPIIPFLL